MGREKDFVDERTYDIPKEYFESLKKQMQINLSQAVEDKDFSGNVEATALIFVTFIHGFHVHGKYNHSKKERKIAERKKNKNRNKKQGRQKKKKKKKKKKGGEKKKKKKKKKS